jgi:hypothetical protein
MTSEERKLYQRLWKKKHPGYNRQWMRRRRGLPPDAPNVYERPCVRILNVMVNYELHGLPRSS